MKKLVCIFFLLHSLSGFCQKKKPTKDVDSTHEFSLDIVYGTRLFNNEFYSQVNTQRNFSFNRPVQVAGIGSSGVISMSGRYGTSWIGGHIAYCQVIPQKIAINDTVSCNLNGYLYSMTLAGIDIFSRSKTFALLASAGFNTGRLRLHGNEWARQKNPFFSPKFTLQPKIRMRMLVLSVRAEYEWDISSPNWRRTYPANENKITLEKFRETGTTILFCVGLHGYSFED